MNGERRNKLIRQLLRALGPLLLVALIWRMKDRGAIWTALTGLAPLPLAAALLLNVASVELKVWRWTALLRARGITYGLGRARAAYYASLYVGMLTPGRVGDVLRVQYLRADLGVPYAEGLASIAMDRICDLYVLVVFVSIAVVRYSAAISGDLAHVTWLMLAATVIGPLLLLVPGLADRVIGVVYRKLAKQADGFTLFLAAMRANVGRSLLVTLPLTFLAFFVNYIQGWLLGRALHLDLTLIDAVCLLAIASMLGLLPITVSGIGLRELLFAAILPTLGKTATEGVTFGLVVFATMYLVLVALGAIAWTLAPPPPVDATSKPEREPEAPAALP